MLIDLHVHTNRYSTCGRSAPEEMAARAAALGFDAIVLTEHHAVWSAEEVMALERCCPGLRVFHGIEVTSAEGDDYVLYGVADGGFEAGMEERAILERAHAQGAVVVLAHPYRYRNRAPQVAEEGLLDGVEVLSNNILVANQGRANELVLRSGAFAVAATDAHHVDSLGLYGIRLHAAVADEVELADVLRRRAFELFIDTGRVAAANAEVAKHLDEALDLISQGHDDRYIRERVPGMHLVVIQGLRLGLDVRRPM